MPLMRCENVTLSYEGRPVVRNLSFSLEEGDYLSIVGENGAGKSTLMKGLAGILRPREGKITVCGDFRRSQTGYLPQQTAPRRDFPASVQEVVLSGCLNGLGPRPFYSGEDRRRADENMERLGLSGIKKSRYADLSGGQQRRALLARALCAAKRLLLLDEPTAGLDPAAAAGFYKLIGGLNAGGMTVVTVSHDIPGALERSRHILHISFGSGFFGTPAEYRASGLCGALGEGGAC